MMNLRERLLLMAALVLLGAIAFKFVIYDPHQVEYATLTQQLATAQAELRRNQEILARADQVKRDFDQATAFIATVEAKLPKEKEIPQLLTAMEQFTKKINVRFNSIRPAALEPVTSSGGATTPAPAGGAAPAPSRPGAPAPAPGANGGARTIPYSKMQVSLSITGSFAQTMAYLRGLREFPRLITVNSISMSPQKLPSLGVDLNTEIYVLPAPGGTPAPGTSAPAPGKPTPAPGGASAPAPGRPTPVPGGTPAPAPGTPAPVPAGSVAPAPGKPSLSTAAAGQ